MGEWKSISHVRWDCKYHIAIVSKYRKETICGKYSVSYTLAFIKGKNAIRIHRELQGIKRMTDLKLLGHRHSLKCPLDMMMKVARFSTGVLAFLLMD